MLLNIDPVKTSPCSGSLSSGYKWYPQAGLRVGLELQTGLPKILIGLQIRISWSLDLSQENILKIIKKMMLQHLCLILTLSCTVEYGHHGLLHKIQMFYCKVYVLELSLPPVFNAHKLLIILE